MTLAPEARELAEPVIGEADRMARDCCNRVTRPARALEGTQSASSCSSVSASCCPRRRRGSGSNATTTRSLPAGLADGEALFAALLNLGRNAIAAGARLIVLRSRAEAGSRARRTPASPGPADRRGGRWRRHPPELGERIFEPMVSGRPGGSGPRPRRGAGDGMRARR